MGIFSKLPFFGDEAVARGTKKVMMNSYNGIRYSKTDMPESYYLKESLRMRFTSWPDYQLESFISDCNNINELIEKIIEQESKGMI